MAHIQTAHPSLDGCLGPLSPPKEEAGSCLPPVCDIIRSHLCCLQKIPALMEVAPEVPPSLALADATPTLCPSMASLPFGKPRSWPWGGVQRAFPFLIIFPWLLSFGPHILNLACSSGLWAMAGTMTRNRKWRRGGGSWGLGCLSNWLRSWLLGSENAG